MIFFFFVVGVLFSSVFFMACRLGLVMGSDFGDLKLYVVVLEDLDLIKDVNCYFFMLGFCVYEDLFFLKIVVVG